MSSYCQVARVLGADGRGLCLTGRVGFDSLPDQLAKKCVKKGFDFNILCIGETGIGKSTLIDSLFNTNIQDTPVTHKQPKVTLDEHTYELQESSVHLRLTVVSTAGYGDQINTDNSCQAMVEYIDRHFESYFQEELKVKRDLIGFHDTRIHACLFLISPTGHSIKNLDLVCMKKLYEKVNVIPVIAKADTISRSELPQFKARIMEDLQSCDIQIYQFPTDDETVADLNARMNEQLPFAVVGSREKVVVDGRKVRARQYPWGTLEVENKAHCEFAKLREMLLSTNMEDLRERTHFKYYEVYRCRRLQEMLMQKPLRKLDDEFEYVRRQLTEETQELDEKIKHLNDMKRELNDKKKHLDDKKKQQEERDQGSAGRPVNTGTEKLG